MENLNRAAAAVNAAGGHSQEGLKAMQAEECGESEGCFVMKQIAVET
jgi:hypothetical protein